MLLSAPGRDAGVSGPARDPAADASLSVDAALAAATENGQVRLEDCVSAALRHYFETLDGHECRDLFSLVMGEVEKPLLAMVLDRSGGSRTKAAQMLGINRGTLRKKLQQHRLD